MAMKKKRVFFICQTDCYGGSEVVVLDLLKKVDYQKNVVYLASMADVFSDRISRLGLPVSCIPSPALPKGNALALFASWLSFLERLRPSKIVLVNAFRNFSLPSVLAAFIAARGDIYMLEHSVAPEPPPKSSRLHFGFVPGLGLWWYKAVWPLGARGHLAKRVLTTSKGVKDRAVEYGYPSQKVSVVYHGVDTSRFSPAPPDLRRRLRAGLNVPQDATVIISTARLSTEKRIDHVIKAFDSLATVDGKLWLLVVGEGPLRTKLVDLANSSNGRDRIMFLGHLDDVSPAVKASDIYVLSSCTEALGIALLEAMSCKLVCVATRTTGPSEIIEDGGNGFLVHPSDSGILNGLRAALKLDQEQRGFTGSRARQTVLQRFRLEEASERNMVLLGLAGKQGDGDRTLWRRTKSLSTSLLRARNVARGYVSRIK
jgi:glycosyltransferase involved in cell wall biosynthesis